MVNFIDELFWWRKKRKLAAMKMCLKMCYMFLSYLENLG